MSFENIAVIIVSLFVSITIHEFMHGFVAYRLGDDLAKSRGRLSFNPLHHIDPLLTILLPAVMLLVGLPPILAAKPVPINYSRLRGGDMGLALVSFAGPATNLVLAIIASMLLRSLHIEGQWHEIISYFASLNVSLFIFNMIPIPPLDGSRVLYAFSPEPVQKGLEKFEQLGFGVNLLVIYMIIRLIGPYYSSWVSSVSKFIGL